MKEAISQVTDELNGLEKRAESVEANFQSGKLPAEEYEAFWKTVKETEDRLKDLKKAKQDLQKEFDGTKLNQEQFEALQREIIQTEKDLKSLEDQIDSTGGFMSGLSSKLGSLSDGAGKVHDVMQPVTNTILGVGAAAIATVPATESLRARAWKHPGERAKRRDWAGNRHRRNAADEYGFRRPWTGPLRPPTIC